MLQQRLREAESLLLPAALKGDVKSHVAALHPHNMACIWAGGAGSPRLGCTVNPSGPFPLPARGMRLTQKQCSEPRSESQDSRGVAWQFCLPELIFLSLNSDTWGKFCTWWVAHSRRNCRVFGTSRRALHHYSQSLLSLGKGQQHSLGASGLKNNSDQSKQPEK